MIKIRMQGTLNDMKWLEEKLKKHPEIKVNVASEAFCNTGTSRYFRRYFEVERKEK